MDYEEWHQPNFGATVEDCEREDSRGDYEQDIYRQNELDNKED